MVAVCFRCLPVALLMVVCVPGLAEDSPKLKTIDVGSNPESVCRGFGQKLYVTLINGDEPEDGTIVVLDGDDVQVFAKGFNAPKGLVFVGGFLITADETTLWKIDREGTASKLVEAKDFPNPIEFLNDVAVSHDRDSVFVSEMSNPQPMFDPSGERTLFSLDGPQSGELPRKGCVYRVTLDGKITQVVPQGDVALRFPNGLAVGGTKEQERLFVADFFTGNIVTFEKETYRVHATGLRGLDGLAVTKDAFYGSSWTEGKVVRIDRPSGRTVVLLDNLQAAADFYHDRKNNQLIIPDMVAGTLTFVPLSSKQ